MKKTLPKTTEAQLKKALEILREAVRHEADFVDAGEQGYPWYQKAKRFLKSLDTPSPKV